MAQLCRIAVALALLCVLANPVSATVRITRSGTDAALPACVAPGGSVRFELNESVTPSRPDDRYQWLFNDQPLAGATLSRLDLANVSAASTGNYTLLRTDGTGHAETSNTLALNVVPLPQSAVDAAFAPQLPAGTTAARPVAAWSDGSVLVEASNQNTGRAELLRVMADGSIDSGFRVPAVVVADVLPDHSVLTTSIPYRYSPDGSARPPTLPAGFNPSQNLAAVRGNADGSFYLAQGSRVARYTSTGELDAAFNCTLAANESVQSIAPEKASAGLLLVVRKSVTAHAGYIELARVAADGARDASFAASPGYEMQYSLHPLADGRILLHWIFEGGPHHGWRLLERDGNLVAGWTVPAAYDGSPYRYVVDDRGIIYEEPASGAGLQRKLVIPDGLVRDPNFLTTGLTAPVSGTIRSLLLAPDERLYVGQTVGTAPGEPRQALTRLRTNQSTSGYAPGVVVVPESGPSAPRPGDELRLTARAISDTPVAYQWLALDGQPLPPEVRSATLSIGNFGAPNLGRYQLRVTNAYGAALSDPFDARATHAPRLVNVSGRAQTGTGEDTIAAGLATHIRHPEFTGRTLLRAAGPALRDYGIADALPNPVLTLFDRRGLSLGTNERWSADPDVAVVSAIVGAAPFAANSADAALLPNLSSGNYTFHVNDRGGRVGVALLEVYQATDPDLQVLLNLSFRARTGPGDATAVAGFVVDDPAGYSRNTRVLVRAVGPTLATQGVARPLANPVLTVFNRRGAVIASNDDWTNNTSGDAAALAAVMKQVGALALPDHSQDAALLLDLPPGAYTMHAQGGEGVVLLEIYLVR